MYDTLAKLTFGVGGKKIYGVQKAPGAPIRKTKKSGDLFLLFFGESKIFVAPPPAKNSGYFLGFIHIYLIELCYEKWKL